MRRGSARCGCSATSRPSASIRSAIRNAETAWARLRATEVNTRWDEAGKHLLAQPVVLITSQEIWVMP